MRRLLCAAAVLATLLAGGCGIPDESDVTVVGDGPAAGVSVDYGGETPVQNSREDTDDLKTFADNYLKAAAGDPDTSVNRVKAFLAPEMAARFPAQSDIEVFRPTEDPLYSPSDPEITYIGQVVGTLKSNGVLEPADATSGPQRYTLRIGPVEGHDGLYVLNAPTKMLMADVTLEAFYGRRTIYWWNKDNTGLVPDLRYMPRTVPTVQQPTTILGWLTGQPASWLADAVNTLPQGTQAADNVPAITNDTLEIRLNEKALPPGADAGALDRLRRQLQWSMRPVPRTITIAVGHNDPVRVTDGEYLDSNPAYRVADVPERFALFDGAIRRLKETPHETDPVPVLKMAANKSIASAAISASPTRAYAAVVTGPAGARQLRVAQAPLGEEADLVQVGGLPGPLGMPVWAQVPPGDEADRAIGLITSNGRIYSFDAAGSRAEAVDWQGGPGAVTALAVAPDGRQVAVVSGGRLYRAVLDTSGDDIVLSAPQRVLPPTVKAVAAVAWISETQLVIAGVRPNGRYTVFDMTADGAVSTPRLDDIGAEPVTYLAAYPMNPVNGERYAVEAYVAGNKAFDVQSGPVSITPGHIAGLTAPPRAGLNPTNPFFLG
ncbi:LpqB family beta-propeller domain-containing protein [Actinoplanes sp. URMC 104]|uniref:LpqB family beta-propeller domain-containing protein n=1 Tax=Actinoplanes sp. URMC 104 TaxID=3423409 RepID=UPI003F1B7C8C